MLFWQIEKIARRAAVDGPSDRSSSSIDALFIPPVEDSDDVKEEKLAAFRQELQQLVSKNYPKNRKAANLITTGILNHYISFNTADRANLAEIAIKTLENRLELSDQHQNVLKAKAAIKESRKNPGKIDERIFEEVDSKMDLGKRWQYDRDTYGNSEVRKPEVRKSSAVQRKIDLIKRRTRDNVYTAPVSDKSLTGLVGGYSYPQLVREAEFQTSQDLLDNSHHLNSLVATGKVLSKQDESSLATRRALNTDLHKASNFISSTFGAAAKVSGFFGRGLWAQSNPNKNENLKNHYKDRNNLIAGLFPYISANKAKSSDLMNRITAILSKAEQGDDGSNHGLLDPASFREITQLAAQIGAENDQENADKVNKFVEKINNLNDQIFEDAKSETADEDAIAKWRLLQLALMVTPFFGVSVMGPVLNVFSGVFMNSAGLGAGLASLLTGEYTGPFGELCELLHLDEFVRWLLCDMPVLSNAIDIIDSVTSSGITQGILGNVVVPLAGSEVASFALAGVAGIFHAERELELRKHKKTFKNNQEKMTEMFANMQKEAEELGEFDPEKFVNKKYEILKEAYVKSCATQSFQEQSEEIDLRPAIAQIMGAPFLKALEDHKITDPDYGDVSTVFDSEGRVLSPQCLMDFLDKNPDGQKFYDNLLLFGELQKKVQKNNGGSYQIDLTEVLKEMMIMQNTSDAEQIISAKKTSLKEEYILQLAADLRVDSSGVTPFDDSQPQAYQDARLAELATVEGAIKSKEMKYFKQNPHSKEMKRHLLPPSSSTRARDHVSLAVPQEIQI